MTNALKLSAEFGTAPVGVEIESWDWSENEDGFKTRYEFTIVPDEAITVTSEWAVRNVNEFLSTISNQTAVTMVRFTIQSGDSFLATTWQRSAQAHVTLLDFLAGS